MITSRLLHDLFLFSGVDFERINSKYKILENIKECSYKKDELILSADAPAAGIALVCEGIASVYSAKEKNSVVLRKLQAGSTFGAASLFSSGNYSTCVIAEEDCKVIYISSELTRLLCEKEPLIALNYIKFLSNRIAFLNKKVSIFTQGSAEAKVAYYLAETANADAEISVNYSLLADMLGMGRASLYRVLDKFRAENIIERTSKSIKVLSREKLNQIIK